MSHDSSSISLGIDFDAFRHGDRKGIDLPQPGRGAERGAPSRLLERTFQSLRSDGVRVLCWKGGDRLEEMISGDGDADILVETGQLIRAEKILGELGFRCFTNAPWRTQPFVKDWIGVDSRLGKLIHVQLYEKLILGSAFDVQIEVGRSGEMFQRSSHFPPVASPADAAIIRLCRAALSRPWLPGRSSRELRTEAVGLSKLVSGEKLAEAATSLFGPQTGSLIIDSFSGCRLGALRNWLRKHHRSADRAGGESLSARWIAWMAKRNRRTFAIPSFPRRILGNPAPVIAVIGSDGSGKSTVSRRVAKVIGQKFDKKFVYFGTGDGPGSWLRWPLVKLKKWIYGDGRRAGSGAGPVGEKPRVPSLAKAVWAIAVARERRIKMRRARKAASAGWLVITDRFPQNEAHGIHDGPRLGDWTEDGGITGRLARWEARVYGALVETPPDLVIHLDVTLETAKSRRPEEAESELSRRIAVARELDFHGARKVTVDADRPLREVVGDALLEIFKVIKS